MKHCMLDIRRCPASWIGLLGLACAAMAGCTPSTGVSLTGNAPAVYNHAYMTVQAIWFNENASAEPEDSGWVKFPLTTPITVDLLSVSQGVLGQLATGLAIPAGTYNQVRLFPVDSSTAEVGSAQSAGAIYNFEVDYPDSTSTNQQTPLELLNPDQGIGIQTTLTISSTTNGSSEFGSTATNTTSTATDTTGTEETTPGLFGSTDNTTTGTTTTATGTTTTGSTLFGTSSTVGTTTTSSTASTTASLISLAINEDGSRDLVPFTYTSTTGGVGGVLLNPHMTAYDVTNVGAIAGTLTLSALSGISAANNRYNIQVTAESLSSDGTRHIAVNSTFVNSDGTFVLYPLSTSSSSQTSYDLVIHGPGIATIIVKSVAVSPGAPSSTTPVSIGTLTPRAANTYLVNLNTTNPLPAGALVGFYQTLPATGEVPYLITEAPIDPFNRNFAAAVSLGTQTIDSGTFSSGAVTVSASTPTEGSGTYRVSATAPMFTDGALTTKVSAGGTATTPVLVTVPALSVESGASSDSLTVNVTAPAGKYNAGELIVSHDGSIVATASLNSIVASGSGSIVISGLPGGGSSGSFASGIYFVTTRTWNTANSFGTLSRQFSSTIADLTNGSVTGFSVSIQ